ncbi:M56 family metallopeptidase [Marinigracilibium pacificum]|uniref:Peptidase M56 domain-containing protein n=1 Tax=Marinigracilibium pacificum TaxID=2729599 RepID=A0A848J7W3_9BACT|nr:M56 family metallopeptidase [Marinigracilibium pacificum]NMM50514.1 hypothetical protein [Marinigracilibium pacificum]
MNEFLIYIFEVAICQAIFYLFYRIFLIGEIYFQKLRLYLTGSLIISFIIPLISIPVYFYKQIPLVSEQTTIYYLFSSGKLLDSDTQIWLSDIISTISICGILISLILFAIQLLKIRSTHKNLTNETEFLGIKVKNTEGTLPTFSFWNTIFFDNSVELKDFEKQEILLHEYYHITDKHSIDMVIHRMATAFLWFSPFIYWQKNALESIQEYIADSMVIKKRGGNKEAYGALIVKQFLIKIGIPIGNFFAKNKTLQRVEMMKYSGLESEAPKLKWTWVIISILFLCFSFNIKEKKRFVDSPSNQVKSTPNLSDFKIDILPAEDSIDFITYDQKGKAMVGQGNGFRYIISPVNSNEEKEFAEQIIIKLINAKSTKEDENFELDKSTMRLVNSWLTNEVSNKINFPESGLYFIKFSINHEGLLDFAEFQNIDNPELDVQLEKIISDSPRFPSQQDLKKRITLVLPVKVNLE